MRATSELPSCMSETEAAMRRNVDSGGAVVAESGSSPAVTETALWASYQAGSTCSFREAAYQCHLPENERAFTTTSDYLTMMDVLAKAIGRTLRDACALTPLQYRLMLRLACSEEVPRAGDLAEALAVGPSTVSTAIAKLVDRGLVRRCESAADMRCIDLAVTKKGATVIRCADDAVFAMMSDYWNSLSRKQYQAALISALSAVERHSFVRQENGRPRADTALVDTIFISHILTAHALQVEGYTVGDFRVLLALRIMGDAQSGVAVARFLFLNSSDITSSLKNLEKRGLIARCRDESNRRKRIVTLTDAGKREVEKLLPVVFEALHETCHSSEELIGIHVSSAERLVERKRRRSDF